MDRQIEKLDAIPVQAESISEKLLGIVFSSQDIFEKLDGQLTFIRVLQGTSEEIGHAFHAVLEIERERIVPEKEKSLMPMPPMLQNIEKPAPNIVVGEQHPKGGTWADFFAVRIWAKTIDKIVEAQKEMAQPQITTSKVIDILDYGRQLESEYMRLLDFYDKAIKRISFFNDAETVKNQRQEIAFEIVKITGIIRAFSRAIVEYRKERFGDRKVGVAAGAMYLEAAKYGQRPYISPFSPSSQRLGRRPDE